MIYASVALFRRNGQTTYRAPRKEPFEQQAQARKAAAKYWRGNIQEPDRLERVVLVNVDRSMVHVAERARNASSGRPWTEHTMQIAQAFEHPHLAACLNEIGVDLESAPAVMPDVLEINGLIYRREI